MKRGVGMLQFDKNALKDKHVANFEMTKLLLPRGYRHAESLHFRLQREPEEKWQHRGQVRALHLFHAMAARVPAYKEFLKAHKFSPDDVRTIEDFARIPTVNKDNYLRKYPKQMLCWDGEFTRGQWVISSTSGSTGEPYYFPREQSQDWQYAISAELYLRNNFHVQKQSTLYIVAFPMGAWIGGLFTYGALKIAAENGDYDLSIITPGIHKQEVINAVKQLGKDFDQIIIGAYAPFLKDILDDGARQGVKWKQYNLGFVFSAEAFTEKFRDYVSGVAKPADPLRFSLNHYGTVDLGTMAHETPETIMIRRHLVETDQLQQLFPETTRQPTFAQYNPELFYFEQQDDSLLCTAYSGIPLVRYDLKDYGGIIGRQDAHERLKASGYNVKKEATKAGIADSLWNLPYVYVYERNDFSVSYYAFAIYPDFIRRPLQDDRLADKVTGKFAMHVDYSDKGRQRLNVNIELKAGVTVTARLQTALRTHLHKSLFKESSEYRETFAMVGEVVKPLIFLHRYEDPEYFRPGTKQKWVIK